MLKISKSILNQDVVKHQNIDFVNIDIEKDTRLFLDPVLIDVGQTDFCLRAKKVAQDFFDCLGSAYIADDNQKKHFLLSQAREINDTHLGYGIKFGRGNTEAGLYEIFQGIENFVSHISLSKAFDFVLLTPGFAEDGMSDLLTNVLYKELSDFTVAQCKKHGIEVQPCNKARFYWDLDSHQWKSYQGNSFILNGSPVVLVPKEIVQYRYRFSTDNYLRSVIVEHICEQKATYDKQGHKDRPAKDQIRSELINENGNVYKTIVHFSIDDPTFLEEYATIVEKKYQEQILEDWQFDQLIYKGISPFSSNKQL